MNLLGKWWERDAPGRQRPASRRWLVFESLERRDLLTIIRLVDWNTLNRPNTATDVTNFQIVLEAIGNESVAGNAKRLDILAVQETDPAVSPGNNSIGQLETILDGLYPMTNYSHVVSSVDGGGDSTGFVYDTATVSLLEAIPIAPETLTHSVLRGKFRPDATFGESDFYVYSIHLKSGDTAGDAALRASEALVLRNDADSLGEGAQVLFVGDFNMKSSGEAAWTNLVAAGAGQLHDPINAPGNWYNNPSFAYLHTQDPGAAMDDRFDLQLASGEFFDGVGVEYVDGSYHAFGNNGTHTFDSNIATGTGASPTVLAALAAASDHLPVVADFEILNVTPGVRIVETGPGTSVVEGGAYDTYGLVLTTVPTADVTVWVQPDAQVNVGNGAGVAKAFTFTPANALTPQTVVVTAVDDLLLEGNHTGLITHSVASADSEYENLALADVVVAIVDNDAPVIVINEIDSDQVGTDMAEFVELYDGGVGNVSLNGKTLVFFNGANDQAYAVFALDGYATDSNGYFVLGNAAVAGVAHVFANNTLQNGPDAVALYVGAFAVGGSVTTTNLLDAIVYDNGQADDAGLLVLLEPGEPQVNENQSGASTTQSLSRVPDGGAPRRTSTYTTQTPTPGGPNQVQSGGVLITQTGSGLQVEEGGIGDSYQLALLTIPTSNVMITVASDGQLDLGAGAGVPIVLTFTPANALVPQTVTVTAVDDAQVEGAHAATITHTAASADPAYNGLAIASVVASIADNDAAPPSSIVISEIMYNPLSDESSPGVAEWIEIVNTGAGTTDLSGWRFDDEDSSNWGAIPAGTLLAPGEIAVIFDVAFTSETTFRSEWSIPSGALVVGVSWGSLANTPGADGDEVLVLLDSTGTVMDLVDYDDGAPWPNVGGGGPSIQLKNLALDNSQGANWFRSTAGARNSGSPTGPTFLVGDVGTPGWLPLAGDYNSNNMVDAADYSVWRDTVASTTDLRADGSGPLGVPDGVVDQLDYDFWKANFGATLTLGGGGSGQLAAATPDGAVQTISSQVAAALFLGSEPIATSPSAGKISAMDNSSRQSGIPQDGTQLLNAIDRRQLVRTGSELPLAAERLATETIDDAFAALDACGAEWLVAVD